MFPCSGGQSPQEEAPVQYVEVPPSLLCNCCTTALCDASWQLPVEHTLFSSENKLRPGGRIVRPPPPTTCMLSWKNLHAGCRCVGEVGGLFTWAVSPVVHMFHAGATRCFCKKQANVPQPMNAVLPRCGKMFMLLVRGASKPDTYDTRSQFFCRLD